MELIGNRQEWGEGRCVSRQHSSDKIVEAFRGVEYLSSLSKQKSHNLKPLTFFFLVKNIDTADEQFT